MALKRVTDLSGNTTTFAYQDAWNAPADFSRILNTGAYGHHSDPTSQTNALGGVKSFTYTPDSRLMQSITDEAGRTTTYVMDSRGRRTKETINGDGVTQVTTFTYGSAKYPGFITRKAVEKQAGDSSPTTSLVIEYVPDTNGNVASEITAPGSLNITAKHTYDANGNRKTTTDPRGNTTTFSYDKRNRLTAVSYPDGGTKYLVYDARGNKIKEYDENGHITLFEYDSMSRVAKQVRDMNGNGENDGRGIDLVTSFTYNDAGSKLSETDPRGNTTIHEYDALQRQKKMRDADGNSTIYAPTVPVAGGSPSRPHTQTVYDANGNILRVTDPNNHTTTNTYDKLNRLLSTTDAAGITVVNQYDAAGNRTAVRPGLNTMDKTETPKSSTRRAGLPPIDTTPSIKLSGSTPWAKSPPTTPATASRASSTPMEALQIRLEPTPTTPSAIC